MKRVLAPLAVAGLTLLSLAGCSLLFPSTPTDETIVGTWIVTQDEGFDMDDSVLTFDRDGTFTWTDVNSAEIGGQPSDGYVDVAGEWRIAESAQDDGAWFVSLEFQVPSTPPRESGAGLSIDSGWAGGGLIWWKDYDLPELLRFERQQSG